MNKKVWMGFIAVFITMEILSFVVHYLILGAAYEANKALWRSDMNSLMWIYHVLTLVGSFFFTFIFSKGYEGKGMAEGVRYGAYIGIWMSMGMAYGTYAMIPVPYSLTLQWFLYGIASYIIAGIVVAQVFAMKSKEAGAA